MTTLHTLSSGSSANCALLCHRGATLMVDAGMGIRELQSALWALDLSLEEIDAVLLTHDHADHVRGLPYVLRHRPDLPIYASAGTRRRLLSIPHANYRTIHRGMTFDPVSSITCTAYEVSHDAQEPLGFRIDPSGGPLIGWATDLGHWNEETVEHLMGCHTVLLESNYDDYMLRTGRYPAHTKRRIASSQGHLSNAQARDLLEAILSPALHTVVLGHLSRHNNAPQTAQGEVSQALGDAPAVRLLVAPRQQTLEVWDEVAF